jgi:hypothetical protein
MEQNFDLIINDTTHHVVTPPQEKPSQVKITLKLAVLQGNHGIRI